MAGLGAFEFLLVLISQVSNQNIFDCLPWAEDPCFFSQARRILYLGRTFFMQEDKREGGTIAKVLEGHRT